MPLDEFDCLHKLDAVILENFNLCATIALSVEHFSLQVGNILNGRGGDLGALDSGSGELVVVGAENARLNLVGGSVDNDLLPSGSVVVDTLVASIHQDAIIV